MKTKDYHYINRLKLELKDRQANNPNYSLRAFSRDIGVNAATVSLILRNKRELPLNKLDQVIQALNLTESEQTLFKESRVLNTSDVNIQELDRYILDESYYNIIAEWEHFAVITLFNIEDFIPTSESISTRLGLSKERVQEVLTNLKDHGLIKINDSVIELVHQSLRTTEDIQSQALRDSHIETLQIASQKIETVSLDKRDYSSDTIAIDISQVEEYKKMIRDFRYKLCTLKSQNKTTDVYQLAVQFFPLTQQEESPQ